jgi:hypothetical protein
MTLRFRAVARALRHAAAGALAAVALLAAPASAQTQSASPALTSAQLETLIAPLAGVPQQMLPAVLDACRYPADIMDAQQSLARPAAEIKPTWNTGVQFLARYAPDLLGVLARDIGATAQLGEAYTRQPNDVLRAYGAVELRSRQPASATPARTAPPSMRPMPLSPATASAQAAPAATPAQNQQRSSCPTRGNPLRGSAGGAARGALIGEAHGDPGRRAAMGGLAGALRRAAERRERENEAAACS